jgi:hypothetical protein
MARRRPVLDMMRPTVIIRAQAFRKGLFGSSRVWRGIAYAIIGKRVVKRYFGREPEIIEVAAMKGGRHWMEIRTYAPQSRRARRRAAG